MAPQPQPGEPYFVFAVREYVIPLTVFILMWVFLWKNAIKPLATGNIGAFRRVGGNNNNNNGGGDGSDEGATSGPPSSSVSPSPNTGFGAGPTEQRKDKEE